MIERADKLNNQALVLASDGSYKEAIACFKRAITIQMDNDLLWYNLGVTYRNGGELENAYNALSRAYKINPQNDDTAEALATLCLALQKYEETEMICFTMLNEKPTATHFLNLVGVVNFKNENYSLAAEFFEEAISINPYYSDALYNLRDTYTMLHMKSGEIECQRRIDEIEK